MTKHLTTAWVLLALLAIGAHHADASRLATRQLQTTGITIPKTFDGTVDRIDDGDTYWIELKAGVEVKVRLHYADSPEVAHNSKEQDQPGGKDAAAFATKTLKGKTVHVVTHGESYGRPIADITIDGKSFAAQLISAGWAWVDPRFHPPKSLIDAQDDANKNKRGLWKDEKPVAPWDWRHKVRTEK